MESTTPDHINFHLALSKENDIRQQKAWDSDASDSDSDDDADETPKEKKMKAKLMVYVCCICLTIFIAIVVTGAWLSANTSDATSSQIAGYALLTVVGIIAGYVILMCCGVCLASCAAPFEKLAGNDSKEFDPQDIHQRRTRAKYVFKRLNDDFKKDTKQHELLLRLTAKALPKEARNELKKAIKAGKARQKTEKKNVEKSLVEKIKSDLKASPNDPTAVIRHLRKRCYVIDFSASVNPSVEALSEKVTLVLKVANPETDIVLCRIESPGGYVATYGLAASQLIRIRNVKMKLIACIDEIAASGGYMMAAVADEIYAAPFSFVGSIGVVAYIPNVERLTKETLKVDVHRFTAGKYKRTVDMFGEVTEEDKAKLREELELIHVNFKKHVQTYRGSKLKDIDEVATGEGWLAADAMAKGLVDRLVTSDDALLELMKEYDVLLVDEWRNANEGLFKDLFASMDSSVTNLINSGPTVQTALGKLFPSAGNKYARLEQQDLV